jgi:hypothetical protein
LNILDVTTQRISRNHIERLAAGRLEPAERRGIVRQLMSQAAHSPEPVPPGRFLVEPVAEGSYEQALDRAFERTCRLHERLSGRASGVGFDAPAGIAAGYSPSVPAGRRA